MGFFDIFLSEDKRISKEQRRLTNRDLQAEDRETAARWLSDNGSGKSLMALLSRFEMKLDHQLNDRDEREFIYGILSQHAQTIERPLRAHLKKAKMIAMPLRLLEDLFGEDVAIEVALELLERERERDDFKPAKKMDLLVWMAERTHPKALETAVTLLADFDEGVRYSAAEVILNQNDPTGQAPLEALLMDPKEESNRLKVRLCEAFIKRGWTVADSAGLEPLLPVGFSVADGRISRA